MKTPKEDFIGMPTTASLPRESDSADGNRSELPRNGADSTSARESTIIRRRPSPYQGRALEKIGHAVEYLIDSRAALICEPVTKADTEAVEILMRLSRIVFSECEEIVPVTQRLKAWMAGVIRRQAH
jgi:hypothetical protein